MNHTVDRREFLKLGAARVPSSSSGVTHHRGLSSLARGSPGSQPVTSSRKSATKSPF